MYKIKFGTDGWRAIIAKDFTVENVARLTEELQFGSRKILITLPLCLDTIVVLQVNYFVILLQKFCVTMELKFFLQKIL